MPKLFPYQRPSADQLESSLQKYGVGLDASDTGTGKTYIACDVAKRFSPVNVAVVCPKVLIPSWERALKEFELSTVFILSYEKVRQGNTPWCSRSGKTQKSTRFNWHLPPRTLLIFDEVHKCKTRGSLNSRLLKQAKRQNIPRLMLSATALASPVDMEAIGYSLGMFSEKDFYKWAFQQGCRKGQWGGMVFTKGPNHPALRKLHKEIFECKGVRLCIEDLADEFPDGVVTAETYPVKHPEKVDDLYQSIQAKSQALQDEQSDMEGSVLTEILRERQLIEMMKVPTMVDLAKEELDEGRSVVLFVNFRDSVDALQKLLSTDCTVTGTASKAEETQREENIQRFNDNESKVIIVSLSAGGAGLSLHDVHGGHPRTSLVSPSYSAQDLIQALGRIRRAGGKSAAVQKIVFASGTVEEKIAASVRAKLGRLSALTDGDLGSPLF